MQFILNRKESALVFCPLSYTITVEPRFNAPYIMNSLLQWTIFFNLENYSKMYGSEPPFKKIFVITNTIHKRKRKIYLNIMNKCQHAIKDERQTDQQG